MDRSVSGVIISKLKKIISRSLGKSEVNPKATKILTTTRRDGRIDAVNNDFVLHRDLKIRQPLYYTLDTNVDYVSLDIALLFEGFSTREIKVGLLKFSFYDSEGFILDFDSLESLSWSKKVGLYKYLHLDGCESFQRIKFPKPKGASVLGVEARYWGKSKIKFNVPNVRLAAIQEAEYHRPDSHRYIEYFRNVYNRDFRKGAVSNFINSCIATKRGHGESSSQEFSLMLQGAFFFLREIGENDEATSFGIAALGAYHSIKFEKELIQTLRADGEIVMPHEIRRRSIQKKLAKKDLYYSKLSVESELLNRDFFQNSQFSKVTYNAHDSRKVFYLLHNSLPYNSGGYATRSHGLLSSVNDIGEYEVIGATRLGYPADHAKYISKPLPSIIPQVDIVDNVKYIRLVNDRGYFKNTMLSYHKEFVNQVVRHAKLYRPQIIHAASNSRNGLVAAEVGKRLNIPSIYEVRGLWEITRVSRQPEWEGSDQYNLLKKLEVEACQNVDRVIVITEALKQILIGRGIDENKISVVPNAVNTTKFVPIEADSDLKEELGINKETIVVGYVGSVVNYEGLDDLIESLAILKKKKLSKEFKFLLVGDGAYMPQVEEKIEELDMNDTVILTGRVPHADVSRYYSIIDIAPFPRKPFEVCEVVSPLKPFEALAMQKAVLVSSCNALIEIIQDGYNGVVFEKGNNISLAEKLELLITNRNLREKVAKNGLEWVRQERDWAVIAKKANDLYDEITSTDFQKCSLNSNVDENRGTSFAAIDSASNTF